jgi:hypothetical protein
MIEERKQPRVAALPLELLRLTIAWSPLCLGKRAFLHAREPALLSARKTAGSGDPLVATGSVSVGPVGR